jgi:hypothetical protein
MGEEIIKKHHVKLFIFFAFIGVLGFVIYTSFSGFSLTGNVTDSEGEGKIKIDAELTIPEAVLNGNFERVEVLLSGDSNFHVGSEKFYLGNSNSNHLIITNYSGKISVNRETLEVRGNSPSLTVNGIRTSPSSKVTTNVRTEKETNYNFLSINDGVKINKLTYTASGNARINDGQSVFNFNDEKITINGFEGSIKIENNKIRLQGYVERFEISGENKVVIS